MSQRVIKGAVWGGIIVFLWCLFSWMVLPMHQMMFNKFDDESAVMDTLQCNAPVSGVYLVPNPFNSSNPEKTSELMQSGPTMFASVNLGGMGPMTPKPFILSLVIQIIGAGIVTWMLLQTKGLKYMQKVGFVVLFGLAVALLGVLPSWVWCRAPLCYTLILCFDILVGWFLAGLAIAKICKTTKH